MAKTEQQRSVLRRLEDCPGLSQVQASISSFFVRRPKQQPLGPTLADLRGSSPGPTHPACQTAKQQEKQQCLLRRRQLEKQVADEAALVAKRRRVQTAVELEQLVAAEGGKTWENLLALEQRQQLAQARGEQLPIVALTAGSVTRKRGRTPKEPGTLVRQDLSLIHI